MNIIGLVSCYNEGPLLESTVMSAVAACDVVGIFEGPVGDAPLHSIENHKSLDNVRAHLHYAAVRRYQDDAEKRTVSLKWAQEKWPGEDTWVVWLDGDEVLIWPEYLRDWMRRAGHVTGVGGFQIRIVELDGSVYYSNGRVVRAAMVRRYLLAASQVELANGMVIALPNEVLCSAGGMPVQPEGRTWPEMGEEERAHWLARCRPPLGGEPHILHRPLLRDPDRRIERQHKPEVEWFDQQQAKRQGPRQR